MLWATPLWHLTIKKKNDRGRVFFCGSRTSVRVRTAVCHVRRNSFLPSKIIHWIIFEVALYTQTVLENFFTCRKVDWKQVFNLEFAFLPIKDWAKLPAATEQSSFRTPENAPDDKRISHSAECAQRRCLWNLRTFWKKFDQKLLFCTINFVIYIPKS